MNYLTMLNLLNKHRSTPLAELWSRSLMLQLDHSADGGFLQGGNQMTNNKVICNHLSQSLNALLKISL